MINKVMQEIIKLNHCAKSSADLSQIWAANEVLISKLGRNNSCHSLQRQPSFLLALEYSLNRVVSAVLSVVGSLHPVP